MHFIVVHLLSCVQFCVIPWSVACQAPLYSTVSWNLLKFMSIVLVMVSNHLILCAPLSFYLLFYPASRSFPMTWLFTSSGQSFGASALALVLTINIQGWFSLGLTALISLLVKGFSRVFSITTVQKHQFYCIQPYESKSHIHAWLVGRP